MFVNVYQRRATGRQYNGATHLTRKDAETCASPAPGERLVGRLSLRFKEQADG